MLSLIRLICVMCWDMASYSVVLVGIFLLMGIFLQLKLSTEVLKSHLVPFRYQANNQQRQGYQCMYGKGKPVWNKNMNCIRVSCNVLP